VPNFYPASRRAASVWRARKMNLFNDHPFNEGDKVLLCAEGPKDPSWFTPRIEFGRVYVIRETLFGEDEDREPLVRLVGVFGGICANGKETILFASHFISLADYRANLASSRRAREGLKLDFMAGPAPDPKTASQMGQRKRSRPASAKASPTVETGQNGRPSPRVVPKHPMASLDREPPAARAAAVETMMLLVNERKRLIARRTEIEEACRSSARKRRAKVPEEIVVISTRLAWLDRQLSAGIPIAGTTLVVKPW